VRPRRRKRRDEAVLRHVERFIGIADLTAHDAIDGVAVAVHQLAIGRLPPGQRKRGQLAVGTTGEIANYLIASHLTKSHLSLAVSAPTTA
jgi:hypothetical protein